jgi:hypothetical protein
METSSNKTARRSQRDYTLGFKLSVVELVEKANSLTNKLKSTLVYEGEVPF